MHDAPRDKSPSHARGDGPGRPDGVDGVQVLVMSLRNDAFGIDLLAQGGSEKSALHVMGRQRISRQQGVNITSLDQG